MTYLDHGAFCAAHHNVPVERWHDAIGRPCHEGQHLYIGVHLQSGNLQDHCYREYHSDGDNVEIAQFLAESKGERCVRFCILFFT